MKADRQPSWAAAAAPGTDANKSAAAAAAAPGATGSTAPQDSSFADCLWGELFCGPSPFCVVVDRGSKCLESGFSPSAGASLPWHMVGHGRRAGGVGLAPAGALPGTASLRARFGAPMERMTC